MGIVNEQLLAEYGKVSIELEIAQNKYNQVKEEIVKAMNAPSTEPTPESEIVEKKGE